MIDRYGARPNIFEQMCSAEFATTYRLKGSDVSERDGFDADDEMNDKYDRNSILKRTDINLKMIRELWLEEKWKTYFVPLCFLQSNR